jgi:hypothetical protein
MRSELTTHQQRDDGSMDRAARRLVTLSHAATVLGLGAGQVLRGQSVTDCTSPSGLKAVREWILASVLVTAQRRQFRRERMKSRRWRGGRNSSEEHIKRTLVPRTLVSSLTLQTL